MKHFARLLLGVLIVVPLLLIIFLLVLLFKDSEPSRIIVISRTLLTTLCALYTIGYITEKVRI